MPRAINEDAMHSMNMNGNFIQSCKTKKNKLEQNIMRIKCMLNAMPSDTKR